MTQFKRAGERGGGGFRNQSLREGGAHFSKKKMASHSSKKKTMKTMKKDLGPTNQWKWQTWRENDMRWMMTNDFDTSNTLSVWPPTLFTLVCFHWVTFDCLVNVFQQEGEKESSKSL